jgi:hypothetical protein
VNLHARPMFNCRERVLTTPERLHEQNVLKLVRDVSDPSNGQVQVRSWVQEDEPSASAAA